MLASHHVIIAVLCHLEVCATESFKITAVSGISRNVQVLCSSNEDETVWFRVINGSSFGLLHLPREFTSCGLVECVPSVLAIPLVTSEMNASSFECVKIDYQNNIDHRGRLTELTVITIIQEDITNPNCKF